MLWLGSPRPSSKLFGGNPKLSEISPSNLRCRFIASMLYCNTVLLQSTTVLCDKLLNCYRSMFKKLMQVMSIRHGFVVRTCSQQDQPAKDQCCGETMAMWSEERSPSSPLKTYYCPSGRHSPETCSLWCQPKPSSPPSASRKTPCILLVFAPEVWAARHDSLPTASGEFQVSKRKKLLNQSMY